MLLLGCEMRAILSTMANFATMCLKSAPITWLYGSAWEQQPLAMGSWCQVRLFHHPSQVLRGTPGCSLGPASFFSSPPDSHHNHSHVCGLSSALQAVRMFCCVCIMQLKTNRSQHQSIGNQASLAPAQGQFVFFVPSRAELVLNSKCFCLSLVCLC